MEKTDILIFDVGLGQSIFVYPHSDLEYGMLIDCGNTKDFEPIDFLIRTNYVRNGVLNELVLTNYDQDHFSGLPYLQTKVAIRSALFASNLSTPEIKMLKEKPHTQALIDTLDMKDRYTSPVPDYNPPFKRTVFHLNKEELQAYDTNNLSQVIFLEHLGSVICISGDLEVAGWKALLDKQPSVKAFLAKTNISIASDHGRSNGYSADVFSYCKPECVIFSDKGIIHDTQQNMSSVYGARVSGDGIVYNGDAFNKRKVLTTRDSGHLWLQLLPAGVRVYRNFTV